MICPYCGTENKDYKKKCKNCKYSLDPQYTGVERKGKRFTEILPVLILILAFAALIALGIFRAVLRSQAYHRFLG